MRARRPTAANWIECIGVVNFDLQLGQRIEHFYPHLVLSPEQEAEIAFLCFPDANLVKDGDTTHHFVFGFDTSEGENFHRANRASAAVAAASPPKGSNGDSPGGASAARSPESSSSNSSTGVHGSVKGPLSARATELFGVARFRQRRDATIQRGALQKSVFVLTRFPFPSLFESVVGALFTKLLDQTPPSVESGVPSPQLVDAVHRAYAEMERAWPPPAPARVYPELTLLGEALPPFETPSFDEQLDVMGTRPALRHSLLSLRDYTAEQHLKMLLARPPHAVVESPPLSARLSVLLQQAWARREPWIRDWCLQEASNSSKGASNHGGANGFPIALPISTQEQFVSLNEAVWAKSLEAAEDLPPSPSAIIMPPAVGDGAAAAAAAKGASPTAVALPPPSNGAAAPPAAAAAAAAGAPKYKALNPDELFSGDAIDNFSVPSGVATTLRRAMEGLLDEAAAVLAEAARQSAPLPANTKPMPIWADVRLSTCFHHHIAKLPKFFELAVLGEDVVVFGADARVVSQAVLGFRSLLGPVPFAGVLRPYLTINNREVDTEASHDHDHRKPAGAASPCGSPTQSGTSVAAAAAAATPFSAAGQLLVSVAHPTIVGATNPFFHRQFEAWPHLICCGEEPEATHKMQDADSDKRAKQQFKLKSRVFSSRHFVIKTDKGALDSLAQDAPATPAQVQQPQFPSSSGSVPTSPIVSPVGDLSAAIISAASHAARHPFSDCARLFVSELHRSFFGLLEQVVAAALRSLAGAAPAALLFLSDAALQSVLEPHSLMERLREEPPAAFDKFKSVREGLTLFAAFVQTPTFTLWLHRRVREHVREVLSTVSLEQMMRACPDTESKIDLLHLLQWELTKQLEGPVPNLQYLDRLFYLNRQALPLRDKLWSDI